jgi:hypothetical protein
MNAFQWRQHKMQVTRHQEHKLGYLDDYFTGIKWNIKARGMFGIQSR